MLDRLPRRSITPAEGPIPMSGARAVGPAPAPIALRSQSASDLGARESPRPVVQTPSPRHGPPATPLSRTELFRRSLLGIHDALDAEAAAADAATAPAPAPTTCAPMAVDSDGDAVDGLLEKLSLARKSPDTVLETSAAAEPPRSTSELFRERLAALEAEHADATSEDATMDMDLDETPEPPRRYLGAAAPPVPRDYGAETIVEIDWRPDARAVLDKQRLASPAEQVWPGCGFSLGLRWTGGVQYSLRLENVDRRSCVAWGKVVITAPLVDAQKVVCFGTRAVPAEFPSDTGKWAISRKIRLSPLDVRTYTDGAGGLAISARLTFHAPLAPNTHSYTYHQ